MKTNYYLGIIYFTYWVLFFILVKYENECEVICEYEREIVSLDDAKRREENYQDQGDVGTLMVLESAGRHMA